MKKAIMRAGLVVLALGCAPVTVTPVVTGGNRAAGTVALTYTHRNKDIVDWNAAQGDAVSAARQYQRYLDEGGADVPADRRREVEQALEVQRARIGQPPQVSLL